VFFNLGPFEIGVLVIVALVVFGPDRLPSLARDAARMIKTLRDLAQGARTQLRDELGPELGNIDLAALNPRTALRRALLDDDEDEAEPGARPAPAATVEEPPVPAPQRPLTRGEEAPFDGDAT
jgi:sec-independent protein translocase protein TatB